MLVVVVIKRHWERPLLLRKKKRMGGACWNDASSEAAALEWLLPAAWKMEAADADFVVGMLSNWEMQLLLL